MKITFLWVLSVLITSARLGAVTPNQAFDRDLANQIWGNPQNWAQPSGSHPNASYFDHPIPIGMGARALGMGEAFTAISDDISGIWWNPAGLTHMAHNEVTWMGGDRVMNANPFTGFFAASYMLENHMVFALSYQRPYHPVGRYPDLLAGSYPFSQDRWVGPGPVDIPGPPGSLVPFSNITDSKVQDFLEDAYRLWINVPFQENIYTFTYATPLSPDRNLAFGFNVKYLTQDGGFKADDAELDTVGGWGVDLGFHYQIPMARFGRMVSFGLNVRDLASQIRGDNNREITLPSVASLGVAYRTQDIFAGSTLNLAADLNYINDPAIEFSHNHRLNVGGEMTFFEGHIAPRLGYTLFFDQPSRATLGIGFNYLIGLDYAYHLPALNEEASHWFSATIRWGGPKEVKPLPDVSVSAEPPIFSPRAGELATFTLSTDSKYGIDRWSLSIFDKNNQAVKTYQDRGTPPSQILWGGEDKVYRLLPDGEYTYLLTATDNMGTSNTSPLQTLHLYTTPPKQVERQDVDNLRKLIKSQQEAEEAVEDAVAKGLRADLSMLIKKKAVNQTLPALAETPEPAPKALSGAAGTMVPGMTPGAPQAFSYPTLNDYPFPRMGFVTMPNGQRSYQVEYETSQTMPRYIFSDMVDMVRVTAKDVGDSVPQYDFRARYGSKVLRMVTSSSSALSLSRGFINQTQFFRNAAVTLDGEPINPSY